jgi:hypothetical protein
MILICKKTVLKIILLSATIIITLFTIIPVNALIDSQGNGSNYKIIFKSPDMSGKDIKVIFDVDLEFGSKVPASVRTGKYFVNLILYAGSEPISSKLKVELNNKSDSQNVSFKDMFVIINKEMLDGKLVDEGTHTLTVKGFIASQKTGKDGETYSSKIEYVSKGSSDKNIKDGEDGVAYIMQYAGVEISIPKPIHNDKKLAEGYGTLKVGEYFIYTGTFRVKKDKYFFIQSLDKGGSFKWNWIDGEILDFTWEFSATINKLKVNKGDIGFNIEGRRYGGNYRFDIDFLTMKIKSSGPGLFKVLNYSFKNFETYKDAWHLSLTEGSNECPWAKIQHFTNGKGFCVSKASREVHDNYINGGFKYYTDDCPK